MTQKEALDILKTGANVFLTGAAGSGKTHVLREYLACLKERKIPVGITASTGIAATHMGGVTIHSWAGIGVKDSLSDWEIDGIAQKEKTAARIRAAKALIIDEISMLHHYRLDMIDRVLKYVRNSPTPFGGLQTIVCGDFFQLPPISRRVQSIDQDGLFSIDGHAEGESMFAYHSRAWREADFTVCYLEENYRQSDPRYLRVLNAVRDATVSADIIGILRERFVIARPAPPAALCTGTADTPSVSPAHSGMQADEAASGSRLHPNISMRESVTGVGSEASAVPVHNAAGGAGIAVTKLYCHNANVDAENERELAKLKTPLRQYEMTGRGRKNTVETLKRNCLAPERLRLKEGARVMFVKNNYEKGYVNGTQGVVKKCTPYEIVVGTARGHIRVETESWHVEDHNGKVLAEVEQYPLRLAWAITIHKSQGMSLDAAEIDLSRSFEKGMGYVALSRVKTLDGLSLIGLNDMALQIHEEALERDKRFMEDSGRSAAELAVMTEAELGERQVGFLGPEPVRAESRESKKSEKSIKGIKRAYKESDKDEGEGVGQKANLKISTVEKTKQLLDSGMTIKEAAAARGLKTATIVNHIEEIRGKDAAWDVLRFKSFVPANKFDKITKMFHKVGMLEGGVRPLGPVKGRLGSAYRYEEIRIVRLFL